jgi:hypothetical protein
MGAVAGPDPQGCSETEPSVHVIPVLGTGIQLAACSDAALRWTPAASAGMTAGGRKALLRFDRFVIDGRRSR